jgi:hypothetical protein
VLLQRLLDLLGQLRYGYKLVVLSAAMHTRAAVGLTIAGGRILSSGLYCSAWYAGVTVVTAKLSDYVLGVHVLLLYSLLWRFRP